jgi:transcriptional regulator with XRE-family HTH domain
MLPKVLADALRERGVSNRAAAREIGISHSTLGRILEGQSYDVQTLLSVCEWLEISPSSVLASEGVIKKDALAAKIAMMVETNPALEKIFEEAIERYENNEISKQAIQDLIQYAAFRLQQGGA